MEDQESFLAFVYALIADREDEVAKERAVPSSRYGPGVNGWENGTIENFSEAMHGAQLLYNLMLAELAGRDERVDEYQAALANWWQGVQARSGDLNAWDRLRFWRVVYQGNPRVSSRARGFVTDWVNQVMAARPRRT